MNHVVTPGRTATGSAAADDRPLWKQVAIPSEHGGWSLSIEPVVLGLLVAWSLSGLAIGVATVTAFLARTPLKLVLVDRWRGRWMPRTTLAAKIAAVELALVVGLLTTAWFSAATTDFVVPLAIAVPLFAIELWYDMRSRGRRLVPELAGTIGIGSSVAAIVLAGGEPAELAIGLWVLVSARAAAAIPYARTQVFRFRGRPVERWHSDIAQLLAVGAVGAAWGWGAIPLIPFLVVVAIAIYNLITVRTPPRRAKVIGLQQMTFGIAVTLITAAAVMF